MGWNKKFLAFNALVRKTKSFLQPLNLLELDRSMDDIFIEYRVKLFCLLILKGRHMGSQMCFKNNWTIWRLWKKGCLEKENVDFAQLYKIAIFL